MEGERSIKDVICEIFHKIREYIYIYIYTYIHIYIHIYMQFLKHSKLRPGFHESSILHTKVEQTVYLCVQTFTFQIRHTRQICQSEKIQAER